MQQIALIIATLLAGLLAGGLATAFVVLRRLAHGRDHASNSTPPAHQHSHDALVRVGTMRGTPRELTGMDLGNWTIAAGTAVEGAKYAAAAIAFAVAHGAEGETPEVMGLRFALWWHGLDTAKPPHASMVRYWEFARTSPRLGRGPGESLDVGTTLTDETLAAAPR